MLIRPIREEELAVCGDIYADAFAGPPYHEIWDRALATEMLAGLFGRDSESCWCVAVDEEIAGYAFCTTYGTFRATIQEVAFAPRYQRKGYGTALLAFVLDRFRHRGIRTVDLMARRDAPAYRLYEGFGFRETERYAVMSMWL